MSQARLEELYKAKLRFQIKEKLNLGSIMAVPRIEKIVLNVGVSDALSDSRALKNVSAIIGAIAGQMPIERKARKSIAGFKLREGMPIGVMTTLRKRKAYEFLDKLINLALPKVRDFQGVPTKLDGQGNYNLGIKELNIFPEAEGAGVSEKSYGMNITIHMTANNDQHGFELLKSFGMPFRKK
jgi:large subunit ribosomal protein L5